MKHVSEHPGCTLVWYDPKPETVKARADLDKILKGTGFTHRTKALWSYYRGNEAVRNCNTGRDLYRTNLSMNGALEARLSTSCRFCCANCAECEHRVDYKNALLAFEASVKPLTIARWEHAKDLIDVVKGTWVSREDLLLALAHYQQPQPELSLLGRIKAAWGILIHG